MPTALLAEDEPLLLAELKEALADLWPELTIVAETGDGAATLAALRQHAPDVAFLDINMPVISGVELMELQPNRPLTIVTTAYSDYALSAYQNDAIDYLLKPISPDKFAKAIEKAKTYFSGNSVGMF